MTYPSLLAHPFGVVVALAGIALVAQAVIGWCLRRWHI